MAKLHRCAGASPHDRMAHSPTALYDRPDVRLSGARRAHISSYGGHPAHAGMAPRWTRGPRPPYVASLSRTEPCVFACGRREGCCSRSRTPPRDAYRSSVHGRYRARRRHNTRDTCDWRPCVEVGADASRDRPSYSRSTTSLTAPSLRRLELARPFYCYASRALGEPLPVEVLGARRAVDNLPASR